MFLVQKISAGNNSTTSIQLGGGHDYPDDLPTRDLTDVVRAPLNWQLAESTANSLQHAADNLVQLYKRISLDYDLEESTRTEFLQRLSSTAGVAQQTLRPVNPGSTSSTAASGGNGANVSPRDRMR